MYIALPHDGGILHRNSSSFTNFTGRDADGGTASCGLVALSVGIGVGVERLIRSDVAYDPGALVGETGKRQCLAHLKDLIAVHLVPEYWIPCRIRRSAVRWRERLGVALVQERVRRGSDTPQAECRRRNDVYPQGSVAQGGTAQDTCGCCRSRSHGTTDAPVKVLLHGGAQYFERGNRRCATACLNQMCAVHAPGSSV